MAQWGRICLPMQETQKAQVQSLGQEDPLQLETVTHSSILAWRIPWVRYIIKSNFTCLFLFLKFILFFFYLSLAVLGLHCCMWTFSSCSWSGGYSPVACEFLIVVTSLIANLGLLSMGIRVVAHGYSRPAAWNLSEPGMEPMSPALAGVSLTTGPPGKSFSFSVA